MKRFLLIVAIFIMISTSAFARKIEITFWHSLGFHAKEIIDEMADEYKSQHLGIKVNPVFQGMFEDMHMKMITSAVTHALPDVAQVQIEYMDTYIDNGLVNPIDNIIDGEDRDDILDIMWKVSSRDGKIYGVPFCISSTVFFYNENVFKKSELDPDKPPSTWEEMVEFGKKLTKDTDRDGKIDRYAVMFWMDGLYGIAPFFWANGGKLLSDDGKKVILTSGAMVKTINMLQDLVFKYKIMPQKWTDWESGQAFLTGNLAMGSFTSAAVTYGEKNLPWKLRIAPMPSINGRRCSILGGSALMNFSKSRKKRKLVNDFIFFLVNKENTIRMHETVGYIPVRKSALNSLELRAFDRENPNYKVAIDALEYAKQLPTHVEFYKINEMIKDMLQRIILDEADPEIELSKTEEKINSAIE